MIRITIKQLRQIALDEMRRKVVAESVDLTSDALATALADGMKQQLDGEFAVRVVSEFFASKKHAGMMFPAQKEDAEALKSQVAQKVMTRLGKDMQSFVESLVNQAISQQLAGAPGETPQTNESIAEGTLPDDYRKCVGCGFDHEYEYAKARTWHDANDDR